MLTNKKKFTVLFLNYMSLKIKVFLAGHANAMVTYYVAKRMCSPMVGVFF